VFSARQRLVGEVISVGADSDPRQPEAIGIRTTIDGPAIESVGLAQRKPTGHLDINPSGMRPRPTVNQRLALSFFRRGLQAATGRTIDPRQRAQRASRQQRQVGGFGRRSLNPDTRCFRPRDERRAVVFPPRAPQERETFIRIIPIRQGHEFARHSIGYPMRDFKPSGAAP